MGRTANVKKVKRAVQGIVDQVLNNEGSLVGLTTLRDYDEYTFTHSVNVCIFSVALGRKLGLSKLQLYDLGMAALFHDVGKSRVPLEVLNKEGGLTEEEWRIMQAHPWLGVLTLFGLRGYGEIPYRGMVVAYEHHMKNDLTGYPKSLRDRTMSIYSKIVAVADGFDAATSRRVYQTTPIQPDQVLKEMWENPRRGYDPVVVKAFVNLIGIYPVGTCVILDTYEVAIVHSANACVSRVHRPGVRSVTAPDGALLQPGFVADGPTIQRSTQAALEQGMTTGGVLQQIHDAGLRVPVVIMTYLNPVLAYGLERFLRDAHAAGASGLLLTDFPAGADPTLERAVAASPVALIRLIAPTTTDERLAGAVRGASGFIYLISRLGVTGARDRIPPDLAAQVGRVRAVTALPIAAGFGISTAAQVRAAARAADGVVVGSALVDALAADGRPGVERLMREFARAVRERDR